MEFIATYRDSDGQTRTRNIKAPSEEDVRDHFLKRKIELLSIAGGTGVEGDSAASRDAWPRGSSPPADPRRHGGSADRPPRSAGDTGAGTALPDVIALVIRVVLAIVVAILLIAFLIQCNPTNDFKTDNAYGATANAVETLARLFPLAVLFFGALFTLALTTLFQMLRKLTLAIENSRG